MDTQLFIPNKIRVGFQQRTGTYTGKLAYVIYYDAKGKIRKEKSWESWRDSNIDSVEFENTPTEGFVLNKGVGGTRDSYGWNTRNEYIRVYDPRDFEFEISVENLLFILRECDCSKGKGLEGQFVYSWSGTDLVLLPAISTDFSNSRKYTDLQSCKIKARELIKGATYETKKQEKYTFIGKLDYWEFKKPSKKRFIFWDSNNFVPLDSVSPLANLLEATPVDNYAELMEAYRVSMCGSKPLELFTKPIKEKSDNLSYWNRDEWVIKHNDKFRIYRTENRRYDYTSRNYSQSHDLTHEFYIKDEIIVSDYINKQNQAVTPTIERLFVRLESGSEFRISNYSMWKEKDENDK